MRLLVIVSLIVYLGFIVDAISRKDYYRLFLLMDVLGR